MAWVFENNETFKLALLTVGLTLGTAAAILILWPCIALCVARRKSRSRNAVAPEPRQTGGGSQQTSRDGSVPVVAEIKLQTLTNRQVPSPAPATHTGSSPQQHRSNQQPAGQQGQGTHDQQPEIAESHLQQQSPREEPSLQVSASGAIQTASQAVKAAAATHPGPAAVDSTASRAVLPPLPPGPIPVSALMPANAARRGHLPPLAAGLAAAAGTPPATARAASSTAAGTVQLGVGQPAAVQPVATAQQQHQEQHQGHSDGPRTLAPPQQSTAAQQRSQASTPEQPTSTASNQQPPVAMQQRQQQPNQQADLVLHLQQQAQQHAQQHAQQQLLEQRVSPGQRIFSRLAAVLQQQQMTLGQALLMCHQQGRITTAQQVAAVSAAIEALGLPDVFKPWLVLLPTLLQQLLPGATTVELLHIQAMLLLLMPSAAEAGSLQDSQQPQHLNHTGTAVPRNQQPASQQQQQQLVEELDQAFAAEVRLHAAAAAGYDPSDVVARLQEYLVDNHDVMAQVFAEFDSDGDARLDPQELSGLVSMIPGLNKQEQGFILAVAAHMGDRNGDGCISLKELLDITRGFQQLQQQQMSQQQR